MPRCENQKGTFLNCRNTYTGAGQSLLKDEGGFKSKIKLRIKPKILDLSDVICHGLDLEVCAPPRPCILAFMRSAGSVLIYLLPCD
jgi:hypothetical protein